MFKKILLPTDGSPVSRKAVKQGVALRQEPRRESRGLLLARGLPGADVQRVHPAQPDVGGGVRGAGEEGGRRSISAFVEKTAKEAGVPYEGFYLISIAPWEAIIEAAKKKKCDLIFMGSHGRSGLAGLVLGSQTTKVLTHSKIPVLVTRSEMKFVGQLLGQHLQRYPHMELADIYKLLHQAAMGPEHAVDDPAAARARLKAEAASLGEGPDDPIADPISPDGKLARIHLRPYLDAGHGLDMLVDAFIQTAQTYPGAPDKLVKFCGCLGDLAGAGGIPFPTGRSGALLPVHREPGLPRRASLDAYRDAYRPAYRVVALDLLPALHRI